MFTERTSSLMATRPSPLQSPRHKAARAACGRTSAEQSRIPTMTPRCMPILTDRALVIRRSTTFRAPRSLVTEISTHRSGAPTRASKNRELVAQHDGNPRRRGGKSDRLLVVAVEQIAHRGGDGERRQDAGETVRERQVRAAVAADLSRLEGNRPRERVGAGARADRVDL